MSRPGSSVGTSSFAPYDRRRTTSLDPAVLDDRGRSSAPGAWTPLQRVAFRFVCMYCVLYLAPFPLSQIEIPGVSTFVDAVYGAAWRALTIWTGAHVLHLSTPVTYTPTGSGDTLGDYVQNLLVLVFAAVATAIWTAFDHRRRERDAGYDAGYDALRVYVRFAVGAILIGYGAAKVIKSQFPAPSLERLVEPYGQFSPMGVLWSFMGTSVAYNVFTGLGEAIGGALLFWRRTTTAGALLLIAVLSNVVLLNFAYDVPVKLFSTNLLLFSLLLTLPDVRRLTDVLLRNRLAPPVAQGAFLDGRCRQGKARIARVVGKGGLVLVAIVFPFRQVWSGVHQYGEYAPKPPLYGIYDVETFVAGHDTLAPLLTDSVRWRRAIFARTGALSVQMMSDSLRRFALDVQVLHGTMRVTSRADASTRWAFRFTPDGTRLRLDGARIVSPNAPSTTTPFGIAVAAPATSPTDSLHLVLRRVDHTTLPLLSRGFHWVQQFPFNR